MIYFRSQIDDEFLAQRLCFFAKGPDSGPPSWAVDNSEETSESTDHNAEEIKQAKAAVAEETKANINELKSQVKNEAEAGATETAGEEAEGGGEAVDETGEAESNKFVEGVLKALNYFSDYTFGAIDKFPGEIAASEIALDAAKNTTPKPELETLAAEHPEAADALDQLAALGEETSKKVSDISEGAVA